MKKLTDLKILQYELAFDPGRLVSVVLERVRSFTGDKWAIRRGGCALGKTPVEGFFYFDLEPMPSSRDANYLLDHRWPSAEKALEFWNRGRNYILATAKEERMASSHNGNYER